MYWKYNTNSSSEIEALLTKEDVTLEEVMDAEDIINQCKGQNKCLIDFLLKPQTIEELVNLTTRVPSSDLDERIRFKYPNIACELLTSDVPAINERLASDKILLDKLYNFLECDPPLNPLLASYFSRIMGALITKKTGQNWLSYQMTCLQVLDFLKSKDTFISLLLKHLGTSAIMDLMLKLMTQVSNNETRQNILNWLDSQNIMQSLVSLLNSKVDEERHHNVAQLLCDFIRIARDTQRNATERVDPDPLLKTLETSETVSILLSNVFEESCESAIVGGIQVLLALLDVNQTSTKPTIQLTYFSHIIDEVDLEQRKRVLLSITTAIEGYIKNFHDLLLNPPQKTPIRTTLGTLDPPFGNTRLQVTRLFAAIISSNNEKLFMEIIESGTFPLLLDLFFKYTWNNFLHTQVENCLVYAFSTYTSEFRVDEKTNALYKHLLVDCNLIERILKAWKDNDEQEKEPYGLRKGYMGHLIRIVNKIVKLYSNSPLGSYVKDNLPETATMLEDFQNTTLKETNALQDTVLGGTYPNTSCDDNAEFDDFMAQYPNTNENFRTYLEEFASANFLDNLLIGFNDDAFNNGDDTLQRINSRTDMNFALSDGDFSRSQEVFKQVCAQSINTLDDVDDQNFEDRDHTLQTVIEKEDQNDAVYSSDSDDDSPPGVGMDVDPWTYAKEGDAAISPLVSSDPWGGAEQANNGMSMSDWADFNSASFEANFDAAFDEKAEISSTTNVNTQSESVKIENTPIDVKNVVEDDKKIDEKGDQLKEKEEVPTEAAATTTTTTTTDNVSETVDNSKEIEITTKNDSIDDIAQESPNKQINNVDVNCKVEDKNSSADNDESSSKDMVAKPVAEPSNWV